MHADQPDVLKVSSRSACMLHISLSLASAAAVCCCLMSACC